ncbi:MAG: nucleoside phosphorylase [Thermodesulfobacteriota bacterium]
MNHDAVINPGRGKKSPKLRTAVMIATAEDFEALTSEIGAERSSTAPLLMSRLCLPEGGKPALVGPMVGAPYAVILLENLIAWGARNILFFGWCGSLCPRLGIGDILLPDAAFIDEGTSLHYGGNPATAERPSASLARTVRDALSEAAVPFQEGGVWTTDAVFRETAAKVTGFRQRGALAVEMETSALFAVGRYRKAEVGAVLAVSDDLSTLKWRPGFRDERLKAARRKIREAIPDICRRLEGGENDIPR